MTIIKTTFSTPAILKLDRVSKRFDDNIAVDGISLQLDKGECLALVGPSGCGKSTTLRLIAGLDRPDWGEIYLHGKCVSSTSEMMIPPYKRNLSLVFQDLALWPHMTAFAHIEFSLGKRYHGKEKNDKVSEILNLVRLNKAKSYPHQLSGGEKQRLAIARSLAQEPQLLLMDEPFSNLDSELKQILMTELKALLTQLKITLVYVTHQWQEAVFMAGRVAMMRRGRVKIISARQYHEKIQEKPKLHILSQIQ